MNTSQRSFDQVKSILGKLDRDIDAARNKRLQNRPTAFAPVSTLPAFASATPAQPALATDPGRSGFGRAKAMRQVRGPDPFQTP